MAHKVVMSGFGGQGIVLMGKLLAHAAMMDGKHSTFFPSYGAAMRGGTANCSVVVSDEEIASPVVRRPDSVIAMNELSLKKFEKSINSGGTIFINSSLVKMLPSRKDISAVPVPANQIAEKLGDVRAANMALLGAFLKKTQAVALETVMNSLGSVISERRKGLIGMNCDALKSGYSL
ncbi:MAG: 2-oxoacid:acceptor oxidoreductase family protein [Candidatus Eisenbacteria bacterium]|nr:2-oxoacid:acceptor oxidoreductase family protein [Candidatus Eisenbacteria bacterium]